MSTSSDGSPLLHNSYKEGREMAQLPGTEANGEIEVSQNSPLDFNPRRDEPSIQFGGLDDHDLDDEDEDFIEIEPLISYQSYNSRSHLSRSASTDSSYMTNNHCHEAKPIHSNKRARRKLTIASVVCLLFVVAEVIGKCKMKFCSYSTCVNINIEVYSSQFKVLQLLVGFWEAGILQKSWSNFPQTSTLNI